jgi:hypothetical protein
MLDANARKHFARGAVWGIIRAHGNKLSFAIVKNFRRGEHVERPSMESRGQHR